MSTTIEQTPSVARRFILARRHRRLLRKALLACGIGYGVSYVIANDVIAASMWHNYNPIDQAISELSGTNAPSRTFLNAALPVFTLLVIGFGIGIWKTAGNSRALRATGGIFIAGGIMSPLWLLFPMTSRGDSFGSNDVGHLVLGVLAMLFIVAEMWLSGRDLGKQFRFFSRAMVAFFVVFVGLWAALSSGVSSGEPTPWMGLAERAWYGTWLLWMAVLAFVLMRRDLAIDVKLHDTPTHLTDAA